ncbi:BZ3500_MvSof-1268-A1-R1_Chr10-2g03002 [Microbotryum saponariae]|uniref:BZ3500_MvSof-1268-A1-R1_Chr10-2g03002 protein n=1 Tax=Microbotryum saponariae TaxID=289078 RepID=A0A2X0LA32_9BASI|nr:BZ3501_MvSof-1269-A2-R1_Chr10-2g02588 [Microbotryum saponariae]SDA01910.1 BZ3500_MvSof-1268-A1-R1_Chr10-2g03002 [Microbotryum saponariae]
MAWVWAWGRIPPRHGPAEKPSGQRKLEGEAKSGRRAGNLGKASEVSSEQQAMLRAKIVGSSKRDRFKPHSPFDSLGAHVGRTLVAFGNRRQDEKSSRKFGVSCGSPSPSCHVVCQITSSFPSANIATAGYLEDTIT